MAKPFSDKQSSGDWITCAGFEFLTVVVDKGVSISDNDDGWG